jgi:uncharacterized protein (TIGR03118 family)
MNVSTFLTSCGAVLMVSASVVPATAQVRVDQTNLVSNIPGLAKFTDPDLVNAWGISSGPTLPFWISDNGTGLATLYSVPNSGPPSASRVPLAGTILPATGAATSAPTGQVFNDTTGFDLKNGRGKALFLFTSEDGAITGWNGGADAVVKVDNGNTDPLKNSVYKGLAISNDNGGTLYATNFRFGRIDAFDSNFSPTLTAPTDFVDPNLPKGYAPFNDKVINGELYVTYAKQDAAKHDDEAGAGNGFVDIFNLDGTLKERLISRGALDSPWGLQIAPSSFGSFAGDLLVGNFGNGMINAYNATTGAFVGTIDGSDGNPLVIDGLWGLTVGNGSAMGGSLDTLFFTAGPNHESDGLFGRLAVPEPSTWAMLLLGFAGLGFAAYRRTKTPIGITSA